MLGELSPRLQPWHHGDQVFPFHNLADPTRQFRFDVSSVASGTTRVLTVQDSNYIVAGINIPQTFTAGQQLTLAGKTLQFATNTNTITTNDTTLTLQETGGAFGTMSVMVENDSNWEGILVEQGNAAYELVGMAMQTQAGATMAVRLENRAAFVYAAQPELQLGNLSAGFPALVVGNSIVGIVSTIVGGSTTLIWKTPSSTGTIRSQGHIQCGWTDSTDATRKGSMSVFADGIGIVAPFLYGECSDSTNNNMQLFNNTGASNFSGGLGVLLVTDAVTAPTSNPTLGGLLYSSGGQAKWRAKTGAAFNLVQEGVERSWFGV